MNTAVRKGYETGRTTTMFQMVRIRMTTKDLQASQKRLRVGNPTERKCLGRLPKQYPTSYTSTDAKASFIRFLYIASFTIDNTTETKPCYTSSPTSYNSIASTSTDTSLSFFFEYSSVANLVKNAQTDSRQRAQRNTDHQQWRSRNNWRWRWWWMGQKAKMKVLAYKGVMGGQCRQ